MKSAIYKAVFISFLALSGVALADAARASDRDHEPAPGERLYHQGLLPNGEIIKARVKGDIELTGKQVICGTCHRRSGMGSSEGDQVIPAITGEMVFKPLRLPTSSDPKAPTQRPAYTVESLKRAIRNGIDSNGRPLDPLMPRYPLSDQELELLIGYMNTLSAQKSPGVDSEEIHFATIIAGEVSADARKALTDVMQAFVKQKNSESRHETLRAKHPPWHKKWLYEPYRKWVMHVWQLEGSGETWSEQLQALYERQPVFAVISGVGEGSWQPVHRFCEAQQLPCLFPTTELPVIEEDDFYSIYLSKGMTLDGELVDLHARRQSPQAPLVQVFRKQDPMAEAAARGLIAARKNRAIDTVLWERETRPSQVFWEDLLNKLDGAPLVVWMERDQLTNLWPALEQSDAKSPLYLSTSLFGTDAGEVPVGLRERLFLTRTQELPARTGKLLLRSTGWFRVKRIYAPEQREIQANAYLALKVAGDALMHIRGYFFRDYLIERIEHTVDNVPYTSVYPRISLAPEQRFAAKGGYITQFSSTGEGELKAVTDWLIPL